MIRFTTTARAALLLTFASGVLTLTSPAFADDDTVPQATLNVAHTDFTSAKSVAHLKGRIRRTAYAICTANSDGKGVMSSDQRQCYDTAMHSGLAQIDSKRMTALRETATDVASAQLEEHPTH